MEIRQKMELKRYLAPQLRQSLNILALPVLDIKEIVAQELEKNPLLEENRPEKRISRENTRRNLSFHLALDEDDPDFRFNLIAQKISLQEILLRQLGMFTATDEEFKIGEEIIGNIDDNGYLTLALREIASALKQPVEKVEKVLKIIQQFEPAGVAGRTVCESLLIQLDMAKEDDPILREIVKSCLDDVAKKNYSRIAKVLKISVTEVETLVRKIQKLNPKPGCNYSLDEIQQVIPDVTLELKGDNLAISINNEDIPTLNINEDYKKMLQDKNLDAKTREFLSQKLIRANELLRAISKRQATLRRIIEAVMDIQQDALKTHDLSYLKPLTFSQISERLEINESTVCRAVLNKYVRAPFGVFALKDFFPSHINSRSGERISSNYAKKMIKEIISKEDKKRPLSDEDICVILSRDRGLKISRRTIAKYREESKILSSAYRKER